MTVIHDPDVVIHAWLEEGPTTLPASTGRSIEVATRATTQRRRAARMPWTLRAIPTPVKLVVAAAVVTAAVLGGSLLSMGGRPSPTPVAVPSADIDMATFTSPRYGYTVRHPVAWRPTPAIRAWPFRGPVGPGGEDVDQFHAPPAGGITFVGFASQPLPDGMTAADWMQDYAERLEATARACGGPASAWTDTTVAGVAGRRLTTPCEPQDGLEVVWVIDGIGYVATGQPATVEAMLESFVAPVSSPTSGSASSLPTP